CYNTGQIYLLTTEAMYRRTGRAVIGRSESQRQAGTGGMGRRRLPAHPPIELIEGQRIARGERIDFVSIEVFVGWTKGRGDGRWPGGLAKVLEDPLNRPPLSDKSDQGHGLSTTGAEEREDFIDPCEQHGPEIAS